MSRLDNHVLLVVGGGADGPAAPDEDLPIGNGRAIAMRCAAEGAAVVVADKDLGLAAETVEAIERAGGRACAVAADVSDEQACVALVEEAEAAFGSLSLLVNNVGIGAGGAIGDTSVADLDLLYRVNLRSQFIVLREALPVLAASGRPAAVVNVSSTAALRPTREPLVAYETTKSAIGALTRSAAMSAAPLGVRVNAVVPGLIDTTCRRRDVGTDPTPLDALVPLGRLGSPWDVAAATCFLLSQEAAYITGTELVVDGGLTVPIG
ncbi:NAD(P)-dependent dehydrogenase, short-chain alcohol dehydrogenase family [Pseudonocardia thermophila]|uniref:NAD(P)-dependent dehydrogenase, short-chain alcohol dehydrogenase family n=1 Tax=Pseudonocardia thermophila TaxID=1848 RepID=A0A1M6SYU7_PSETH|nr:SDR family oxidoreductase [Pseudonocardia thermophila]SHK49874.1 NAD(P)-dependent dehydrogenase, short-chain alcohol dehydrogenase family [Pseudonocardia thermophila]